MPRFEFVDAWAFFTLFNVVLIILIVLINVINIVNIIIGIYVIGGLAFAIVLESERERLFKPCGGFVKCEERLVWLLASLALSGSEDDLETVGPGQADGRR